MKTEEELYHHYWAVAFVDLLGQRAQLEAIDYVPSPDDSDQMKRFYAGIKKTYGAVNFIQDSFVRWNTMHDRQFEDSPILSLLDPKQRRIAETMRAAPLHFQRFSDGLVVFMSLADTDNQSPAVGLFSILAACAAGILSSLATETPIRIGIDVGTGAEMARGEIYGPVVAKAYDLESMVAQYPRAVVGPSCLTYINAHLESTEGGRKNEFDRAMIRICDSLLMVDADGHVAVDYLGPGFKKHLAGKMDSGLYDRALSYVINQLEEAKRTRNTKLSMRYTQVLAYFSERSELWAQKVPSAHQE